MDVMPEDARATLDQIESVQRQTLRSLAASYASGLLILWGLIWTAAFAACHVRPERAGAIWGVLDVVGICATLIFCHRKFRSSGPTRSPQAARLGWRIFWFWMILFGYVLLWQTMLRPTTGIQVNAFLCTAAMLAYVVMGLWLESRFLLWLGLAVTALTILGYYPLRGYYNLWMAATGGPAMLAVGWYLHRRWR